MDNGEKTPWVNYLEGDVLNGESPQGYRVYQVVLRIRGEGLQAVVKARKQQGFFVIFVGSASLPALAAKIRKAVRSQDTKWREDKYAPT